MKADSVPIPLELKEQIEKGNCVLFASEGITTVVEGSGLTSRQLAQELASRSDYSGSDLSLPTVAQYYEIQNGRRSLVEYVVSRVEATAQECLETHKLIARLPFKVIISTSYDILLEQALRDAGRPYIKVISDLDIPFTTEDKVVLLKLYGSIDRPESLVITEDDHLNFFEKHAISGAVKFYAAAKTVIFVSYDLVDRTFSRIHWEATKDLDKFRRRTFAVRPGLPEPVISFWKAKDIEIINTDALSFLRALEGISKEKTPPVVAFAEQTFPAGKRPYKFLDYYEADDAGIFFGRTADTNGLAQHVLSRRLVVLFGKSGVGKTSILKAGLVSALEKYGYLPVYVRVGDDPTVSVKHAISDRLALNGIAGPLDASKSLKDCLQQAKSIVNKPIVVILDQFEEFSTRLGKAIQLSFQDELRACIEHDPPVAKFVLSLREDFLAELHELNLGVPDVFHNRFRLRPFTREQAQDAILLPALRVGMRFEPGLAEQIISDLSQVDEQTMVVEPPHLQIVCDRLYDATLVSGENTFTAMKYNKLGGTKRLLEEYLDSVLLGLSAEQADLCRRVLKAMVTSRGTKTLISFDELSLGLRLSAEVTKPMLDYLVSQRLIRRVQASGALYYELAHEHLIHKIQEWVNELEMRAKAIQDLLRQELNNWSLFGWLMDVERFKQIDQERDNPYLSLSSDELILILRCVLRHGIGLDYWLSRIGDYGISIWNFIEEGIANESAQTRAHTVEVLGRLGTERSVDFLSMALGDDFPSVRARAITALYQIGTKSAYGALRDKMRNDSILIPEGTFNMGPSKVITVKEQKEQEGAEVVEEPACEVALNAFYIDKYPVTNQEYKRFIDETGHAAPSYWDESRDFPQGKADHPVVRVTWYDAKDYATWAGKRLPTEAEWERAARGPYGFLYPWGNLFDKARCNTREAGVEDTVSVYAHSPAGDSPYGVSDMIGNTWEWTSSHYRPYPYDPSDGREQQEDTGTGGRVRRGGSWFYSEDRASAVVRYASRVPVYKSSATGFRCALSIPTKEHQD